MEMSSNPPRTDSLASINDKELPPDPPISTSSPSPESLETAAGIDTEPNTHVLSGSPVIETLASRPTNADHSIQEASGEAATPAVVTSEGLDPQATAEPISIPEHSIPLPEPEPEPAENQEGATPGLSPLPNGASQMSLSSLQDVPLDSSPPAPPAPPAPFSKAINGERRRLALSVPPSPVSSPIPPESRRSSVALSQGHTVSVVHITSALDVIAASKEAKRAGPLKDSVKAAQDMLRTGQAGDRPREIFEPLRLACETRNEKLMIASLDCISKLVSHSFLTEPASNVQDYVSPPASPATSTTNQSTSLADLVTHTVTSAYTESTPDTVSLQIVKALLSLVLSTTILVHHSSLLKAVRTVYNVFLLSQDSVNQMVAQGGLTQMVNHVFSRCQVPNSPAENGSTGRIANQRRSSHPAADGSARTLPIVAEDVIPSPPASPAPVAEGSEIATNGEHETKAENGAAPITTLATYEQAVRDDQILETEPAVPSGQITTNDLFIKDAFLVFRALCKLTMKPLAAESERDLKSHAMRSKLLSLHLVLSTLDNHTPLFVNPSALIYSASTHDASTMLQATKQYLLLSLSRNAVSAVPQVFDISVEIFWRVLSGMRTKLKKEIEVLLNEIFLPILEMRNSTIKQKTTVLSMIMRLCQDPQALVEVYLNYDCDRDALENIYERLMNIVSKIGSAHNIPGVKVPESPAVPHRTSTPGTSSVPPSLTTAALGAPNGADLAAAAAAPGSAEAALKRQGLECLVAVLRSLVAWGTVPGKGPAELTTEQAQIQSRGSVDGGIPDGLTANNSTDQLSFAAVSDTRRGSTSTVVDDPTRFESEKQKKTTLLEGIRKFNFKPKRGISFLLEHGFIESRHPQDIAKFLHETDGLSKAMIGEYLGEGDEENVAIMHAFVDMMDFTDLDFVEALRLFLQSFRLPGEAQKIDRYMLKFAARYMAGNSNSPFANADTLYVLAYSTILLNTDAYNPQVKNRMTRNEFIRNNRGINDGADLPEELLNNIYDSIYGEEIRMKDEIETSMLMSLPSASPGLAGALANVGRDLQKEAYVMQSTGMANKTEALFKTMMRSQRKGKSADHFYSASHFVHVRPMFEVAWMSFLAGLSGPLQDTDDLEVVELCLDGFKSAIRIVCYFDLELERNAFVTTLAKFTFLNNLGEMKTKNMEAIKALLDIAVTEGNQLRGSWHEVLTCVSQLERMQLISSGVDVDNRRGSKTTGRSKKLPAEELANESRSTHITVAADMVFSLSHYLNGTAIVDFVRALSDASWEEIQSSGLSEHPRLFSLQKLVDISYYNMGRIRLEWSNMWTILGDHFNQICCHNNPRVAFFALDALRQLAMRFLEKEELPHFKFQKDFLKPFEFTMIHNQNPDVREMVLQCLQQMIQLRVENMRSGWRTMFGVFSAASKVLTERVAMTAFDIVTRLNKDHFAAIVSYGSFADLTVCITDFCKVSKYQKISLLAITMLRGVIPTMLHSPECGLDTKPSDAALNGSPPMDDPMIKFWYPVLFSFYDIIMNGEDLEVRRLALDTLFNTLKKYGSTFRIDFWDTVCQELLFPIFAVLRSTQDLSRFHTQEDMSVWLSTTMIQALRNLIDLYTFYFEILERTLDGLLDLLCVCICQENDTLARIGTSCFQQLLENNVRKLSVARWERVVTAFVRLFKTTTPHQLFDESLRIERDSSVEWPETNDNQNGALLPAPLFSGGESPTASGPYPVQDRRRIFKQIIVECVLQLLLIETTHELLQKTEVYSTIPPDQLLRLMAELDHSYQFARGFNADKELRTGLWKVGFMKHLPNLLKQESSSAATLVNILLRMYLDKRPQHQAVREQVVTRLVPLGLGVVEDFNALKAETQGKNIVAWTPVVTEVVNGFVAFDDQAFARYLPAIYPLVTGLLSRDMAPELREAARKVFDRVGKSRGITERT